MNKNFDKQAFNARMDAAIADLQAAEKITKAVLSELSRLVLEQIHFDGDIQPVNRLLGVLTPMNRKTAVIYFQHFSGHLYSEKEEKFGRRDKGNYAKKLELSEEFLAEPHNNIWTWAERNIQIEAKPFDMKKITKFIESSLKKAQNEGYTQADVFKAIIAGGLELDTINAILAEAAGE